jgi:hypothetical protein
VRRAWLCAALVGAGLLAAPAVRYLTTPAAAEDKDKEKKEKEEKEKKQREEKKKKREKALREIGDAFGAEHTKWLLDRVPAEQNLTLDLGTGKEVDYALDQARGVVQKYFDDMQTITVETTSEDAKLNENSASFPMKVRRTTEKKEKSATLYVTIDGLDTTFDGRLTKLVVVPQ